MIIEDYVSFEIAKMLKEKGFDESCQNLYRKTREILSCGTVNLPELTNSQLDNLKNLQAWIDKMFIYTCPTLQMAMKWLRKEHELHCHSDYDIVLGWYCQITSLTETVEDDYEEMKHYHPDKDNGFSSPEEACEEAIRYCLKNLI